MKFSDNSVFQCFHGTMNGKSIFFSSQQYYIGIYKVPGLSPAASYVQR